MAYPQTTFTNVTLAPGSILSARRDTVLRDTLSYQLDVLKQTGRYDAFKLLWHPTYSDPPDVWPIPNHLFWDSDVAKWIEGACYLLHRQPQPKIDDAVKDLVNMIKAAQQSDGYINIHYTVVEPGKRFSNLRDFHELYNAGHLIEAALAHHHQYGNKDLLDPILKYVDLLCRTFGPDDDQIHGYPGHPEIELALLRLYDRTKDPRHLKLGMYFLSERGNPTGQGGRHYYVVEAEKRGDDPDKRPKYYSDNSCLWYYQAHTPIVDQFTIEGHSVRAMYLLTAAADLVRLQGESQINVREAVSRLWNNMTNCKMYATGGIGAIKQWEGFGLDYFLPQGTDEGGCYAETCAAIGVMMLAQRILQYDLDHKYGDIMELCLYNAVMTAMSEDGKSFTYINQLCSSDEDLSQRSEWFTCACCPPNMLRLLGHIGGYVYATHIKDNFATIDVHLFVSSNLDIRVGNDDVQLTQTTNWPWEGKVKFKLSSNLPNVTLRLRIPAWADSWEINPAPTSINTEKGYLAISSDWLASNPEFEIEVPIQTRVIASHPYTTQDTISLVRGPIVYCVEDVDNPWVTNHFKDVQLNPLCSVEEVKAKLPQGMDYVALSVHRDSSRLESQSFKGSTSLEWKDLSANAAASPVIDDLKFVPYYLRANRGGQGHCRVGLRTWHR